MTSGNPAPASPPVLPPARPGLMLGRARYLAAVAVAGLFATTVTTFGWAVAKTVKLVLDVIAGGWRDDLKVVDLLVVIDTYLLAVVQLIVVIGLYELFIGQLAVPEWLKARSLSDLKKALIDVFVVFVAIKAIERLVSEGPPLDALIYVAAVAVLIGALTWFRAQKDRSIAPAG